MVNAHGWAAGIVQGRAPFLSTEDERLAEGKIDSFMADVLIPLAAQTNAVVLCNAIPALCILTASFTRMFAAQRARWGDQVRAAAPRASCAQCSHSRDRVSLRMVEAALHHSFDNQ